jgi:hypothetical protein
VAQWKLEIDNHEVFFKEKGQEKQGSLCTGVIPMGNTKDLLVYQGRKKKAEVAGNTRGMNGNDVTKFCYEIF